MANEDNPLMEPAQIGPFKLLAVLGEGGMGVVYLAEQTEPVRRRVALKILKLGMDTKQVIARFESERQALAVMDHPNIARALDGGVTEDGRPYFVMELVHGTPITDYADRHRLTTAERLRLFIDICHAVQHAHQKGVIHRDLKPSNVMVAIHDSGPMVKVIDFGIAKAIGMGLTDRTLVTRTGQLLGTPEYMSPEQAEMSALDIDTRADIYSLGVMLYELVVGALPFDLTAKPDYVIWHTLREQDVPRPSTRLAGLGHTLPVIARDRRTTPETLRREVRGDLDWIILKAMDKDRTRRYDTANGLALDVERHLNNEPVRARPPSTQDRMTKFIRRNRIPVIAGSVAIIAILAGAAAATVGFVHARQEQRRAEQSALAAEQSAATAEQVSEFLTGLFRVSNPSEALGSTITAREVLDVGAERIRTELADQPTVQAPLMRTMGVVYRNLGLYDASAALLERAVAIGSDPAVGDPAELARALQALGISYRRQGRAADAESALRRAVEVNRARGATETAEFASIVRSLAAVHQVLGRYADAEPLLREALSIQERVLVPDDPDIGITVSNLGAMYLRQRRPADAEPYLRRALGIAETVHGADHPWVADELSNLGALDALLDRHAEAEAAYTRAYEIMSRVLDPDHPDMARILNNLGEASFARGDYDEAESRLITALAIKERSVGPDHISVPTTLKWLGNVYREQGRYEDAEPLYIRALAIYDRTMDRPDAAVGETLEEYARLLRATGRAAEASTMEARAARIREASGA
jgi:eukaryotic-like serine/threonine-protein kinase